MQLKINSTIIPLNSGTNLPLVLRSPLFLTDKGNIPGSYIFNFSVPAGNEIRKEFGQAHRAQRHERATAELPYLITDGLLRFSGNCIITEADQDSYEISCKIDNGDFTAKLSGKTLKDLNLGGDRIMSKSMCAAHDFEGITVSEQASEDPFSFTSDLQFKNIDIDINAELSVNSFIAQYDETLVFSLKYILAITNASSIRLNLYINDVIVDYGLLLESETMLRKEIDVLIGDVFTIKATGYSALSSHEDQRLDYYLSNLIFEIYSKINAYTANNDYAVFPIHNENILDNFPDDAFFLDNLSIKTLYSKYFKVINYYKDNTFPLLMSGDFEGDFFVCANLFCPFVFMSKILQQIATEAGYLLLNNPFEFEFKGTVFYNPYIENTYDGNDVALIPVKTTFNLSDHVSDMSQNDFIKAISILTGYMPIVDNNLLTITFTDLKDKHVPGTLNRALAFPGILLANPKVTVESEYTGIKFELKKSGNDKFLDTIKELNDKLIFKGSVATLALLPASNNVVNDMYLVSEFNEYYVYQYNPDTYTLDWLFYSKLFPLVYTEGVEPYKTLSIEFSPILMSTLLDETPGAEANRNWTLPLTQQPGILEGFPDSLSAEYGLQVLYYKGLVEDSLGATYPLGSSKMSYYSSNPYSSPDLNAESIFNERYSSFLKWLTYDAKPVTIKTILTRSQLRRLKFDRIYHADGFNFLIKEVRINMGVDGLSVGEMEVLTC